MLVLAKARRAQNLPRFKAFAYSFQERPKEKKCLVLFEQLFQRLWEENQEMSV